METVRRKTVTTLVGRRGVEDYRPEERKESLHVGDIRRESAVQTTPSCQRVRLQSVSSRSDLTTGRRSVYWEIPRVKAIDTLLPNPI